VSPPAPTVDKLGNPFELRAYRPEDRRDLEAMYDAFEPKRVAQGLPPDDPGRRHKWLDGLLASGLHLVVEIDGRIRGHGMLLPFEERSAELANFLHQSARDRGIGTALNRALVDAGRAAGFRRIWLCVEPSNRRAIRSYEKVGFRRRVVTGWAPELEMEAVLMEDTDGTPP
jgi:ribosomal protein S18 acetylase RimI-like enzyme